MPAPEEAAWKSACEKFYLDGDSEVSSLIEFVQSSDPKAGASAVNMEEETALEKACGVRAAVASAERRARYLQLKDEARRDAHAAALARRRTSFTEKARALPSSASEPPTEWSRVKAALEGLQSFCASYWVMPICQGIARLLREQERSERVLRWRIDCAALYESGAAPTKGCVTVHFQLWSV